jgi:tetratricopeptide (TPR) repeat protein
MKKSLPFFSGIILCIILILSCSNPQDKKMKFFNKGKHLYHQGNYIKAALEFKNAVQIDPQFSEAFYMLGMVELQKKDMKRAYGNFVKVVELNPRHISAHLQIGKILLMNGMLLEAKEKAEDVLMLAPMHEDALILKASLLMLEKDSEGAITLLTKLHRRGVKQIDLFILTSAAQMMQSKTREAEKTLISGIDIYPGAVILHQKLAEIYLQSKQYDSAIATMQKIIGLQPGNMNFQLDLANVYWQSGRSDRGNDLLQQLAKIDPKNEEHRLRIAGFYMARGLNRDAERELSDAIRTNNKSFHLRFALGELYLRMNMTDSALTTVRECLRLSRDPSRPDIIEAKNILARIHLARRELATAEKYVNEVIKESSIDADAHFTRGNIFMIRGDGNAAVAEFRGVIREKHQFIPGHIRLADAHILNKEYELAESTLQSVLKQAPESREIIRALARLSTERQNYEEAGRQLREFLKNNPDDPDVLVDLGDLYLIQKDYSRAENAYREIIRKAPQIPVGYARLANLYQVQGNLNKATEKLEQALKLEPESISLLSALVQILIKQVKFEQAASLMEKRIKKNPQEISAYNILGQIYILQKNNRKSEEIYRQAIPVYQDALKKQPQEWTILNDLAFLLAEYGQKKQDLEQALFYAQQALERKPGEPAVFDTLGWIYFKKGNINRALDLLGMAQSANPASVMINYHLGMALYKAGKREQAKSCLSHAVKSGKSFNGRSEAITILETL